MANSPTTEITDHLIQLEDEFKSYFCNLNPKNAGMMRNPFLCDVDDTPEDVQEEFLELMNDSMARGIPIEVIERVLLFDDKIFPEN